jgi:hypothetical protein
MPTVDSRAPPSAAFGFDQSFSLLASVERGLGTTYTIASAAAQGFGAAE